MVAEVVKDMALVQPGKLLPELPPEPTDRARPADTLAELLAEFLSSLDKER